MEIAIMQPYFLPYIGYFQLINAADIFVIYDNIKYTKKGWINRNRILVDGQDEYISLPLKKDSDFLNINQRYLADSFATDKEALLRKIHTCYRKAPYFEPAYAEFSAIVNYDQTNLFDFLHHSLVRICAYIGIKTPIIVSSGISIDHELKKEQKVYALCKALEAQTYINPIGGKVMGLYDKDLFLKEQINLEFLKTRFMEYNQFGSNFIPWLSILDIMMFNDTSEISRMLNEYDFV